jgi:hypothetical protein
MPICFVANKDFTVPLSDFARYLQERGETIVWLSPSSRWSSWLETQGWPRRDILNLPDFADEWKAADMDQSIAALADLETEAPATIGNLILMCRNLRRRPKKFAYGYLAAARRHIEPFLRSHAVEVVFGEGTWGFEQVTWLVCQRIGIPMLTPATTRIPSDRFYLAHAISGDLFEFADSTAEDRQWAEKFFATWTNRPVQPEYARTNRGYKPFHRRWLKELAIGLFRQQVDRDDETLWPLHLRIRDRARRAFNALTFRLARPFQPAPPNERYVLFGLHHQPEGAIDVYGALHSNQSALIETISRTLPATHMLWVKEHVGALGDRSLGWYRKLSKLPNVRFVDPRLDIYGLVRGASLVVTITGTVGYETALMGIPVVALAPIFFAPLMSHRVTNRSHPLEWSFRDLLTLPTTPNADTRAKRIDFLARLHANSFVGNPAPLEFPDVQRADPNHLKGEKQAFVSFMEALRRRSRRQDTLTTSGPGQDRPGPVP